MSETGFIYALFDPRDDAVRYVGQTVYKLKKRLIEHYSSPRTTRMRVWVQELADIGLRPGIKLIEEVPLDQLNIYEDYWLGEMAYQGCNLLNSRLGQSATAAYLGRVRPIRPHQTPGQ